MKKVKKSVLPFLKKSSWIRRRLFMPAILSRIEGITENLKGIDKKEKIKKRMWVLRREMAHIQKHTIFVEALVKDIMIEIEEENI